MQREGLLETALPGVQREGLAQAAQPENRKCAPLPLVDQQADLRERALPQGPKENWLAKAPLEGPRESLLGTALL